MQTQKQRDRRLGKNGFHVSCRPGAAAGARVQLHVEDQGICPVFQRNL